MLKRLKEMGVWEYLIIKSIKNEARKIIISVSNFLQRLKTNL